MARLRTEEEKSAIVAHCLELEQTGGDILAYLLSENYVTPRATWCNFQREWLGRKPYEFTDGKPKTKKERENMARLVFTEEQKMEAVRIAIEGGSPYMYLKGLGAKNPSCVWMRIKSKLAPEILAKIPKHPTGWKAPKKLELDAGESYEINVKDAMDNLEEAADTFFGQCEDMGLKVNGQHEEETDLETTAVRHKNYGEFYRDHDHNCIDWRTPEGEEVTLSVNGWKGLLEHLPVIMRRLGVEL